MGRDNNKIVRFWGYVWSVIYMFRCYGMCLIELIWVILGLYKGYISVCVKVRFYECVKNIYFVNLL